MKVAIRSRKSKEGQHNGQKKNDKERQAITCVSTNHHREN